MMTVLPQQQTGAGLKRRPLSLFARGDLQCKR